MSIPPLWAGTRQIFERLAPYYLKSVDGFLSPDELRTVLFDRETKAFQQYLRDNPMLLRGSFTQDYLYQKFINAETTDKSAIAKRNYLFKSGVPIPLEDRQSTFNWTVFARSLLARVSDTQPMTITEALRSPVGLFSQPSRRQFNAPSEASESSRPEKRNKSNTVLTPRQIEQLQENLSHTSSSHKALPLPLAQGHFPSGFTPSHRPYSDMSQSDVFHIPSVDGDIILEERKSSRSHQQHPKPPPRPPRQTTPSHSDHGSVPYSERIIPIPVNPFVRPAPRSESSASLSHSNRIRPIPTNPFASGFTPEHRARSDFSERSFGIPSVQMDIEPDQNVDDQGLSPESQARRRRRRREQSEGSVTGASTEEFIRNVREDYANAMNRRREVDNIIPQGLTNISSIVEEGVESEPSFEVVEDASDDVVFKKMIELFPNRQSDAQAIIDRSWLIDPINAEDDLEEKTMVHMSLNPEAFSDEQFWQNALVLRDKETAATQEASVAFIMYLEEYAKNDIRNNQGRFLRILSHFLSLPHTAKIGSVDALIRPFEVSEILHIDTFNWYALFRFFAVTNNEIVDFPEIGKLLEGINRDQWVASTERMLRTSGPRLGVPSYLLRHVNTQNDFILRRLTVPQIELAMTLTAEEIVNHHPRYSVKDVIQALSQSEDQNEDDLPLKETWCYFLAILIAIRFLWSHSSALPDLLLKQHNYLKIRMSETKETLKLTTVTPFMWCSLDSLEDEEQNPIIMPNIEDRCEWIRKIIIQLAHYKRLEKLQISIRIKRVMYVQHQDQRSIEQDTTNSDLDSRWFTIKINLFLYNVHGATIRNAAYNANRAEALRLQDINLTTGFDNTNLFHMTNLLNLIENNPKDQWRDFLTEEIFRVVEEGAKGYKAYDVLDPLGHTDQRFCLIHDVYFLTKIQDFERKMTNDPERLLRGLRIFRKGSASNNLEKLQHCVSLSRMICLFEVLWTYKNHQIFKTRRFNNKTIWGIVNRTACMYQDFHETDPELKQIAISGSFMAWNHYLNVNKAAYPDLVVLCLDEIHPRSNWDDNPYYIVHFNSHAVFATSANLNNYAATLKPVDKEDIDKGPSKKVYRCMPRKQYEPSCEDPIDMAYDIEAYCSNGKFIPYLVCVRCADPNHPELNQDFWGVDVCVPAFVEWLRNIIEDSPSLHHGGASQKYVMWGFNCARFDHVFILHQLSQIHPFVCKGEFTNPKFLTAGNCVFLDFLKLFQGSMVQQQQTWNTVARKKTMNHDITPESFRQLTQDQIDIIIDYCRNDCIVLLEFVQKYKESFKIFKVSPWQTSMASLSLNIFKTLFASKSPSKQITGCLAHQYEYIKDSYIGGIVDVYHMRWPIPETSEENVFTMPQLFEIPEITAENEEEVFGSLKEAKRLTPEEKELTEEEQYEILRKNQLVPEYDSYTHNADGTLRKILRAYDMNSAYPFQNTLPVPIATKGDIQCLRSPIKIRAGMDHNILEDRVLYQVSDLKWEEDTYLPTLPNRTEEGLRYTTNLQGIHRIWGLELKLAIETKQLIAGTITHKLHFKFEPAFKEYIETFYERRKECGARGDKLGKQNYKLLMNTIYGKFGQRRYPDVRYVPARNIQEFVAANESRIIEIQEYKTNLYQVTLCPPVDDIDDISHCVHVASWITMSQRVEIRKTQLKILAMGGRIFYTDTDSIICDIDLPPELCSETELGKWKLEAKIIEAYFVMKKAYCYLTDQGKYAIKFKGVQTQAITWPHMVRLAEGLPIKINSGTVWTRKYDKKEADAAGYVIIKDDIKMIRQSKARKFDIKTGESRPL